MLCLLALVAGALVAGCGEDEEDLEVVEGEPVELGDLLYNVQITRFLNANDPEDEAYLAGQASVPPDEEYLAVFMTVENEGDEPEQLPDEMTISDTRDNTYEPLDSNSVYALDLGVTVPPGDEVPAPDTPAASGPIKGGMVVFRVDRAVTENRPIELHIPSGSGEEAVVELDI
jgi:hypothetical protein